MFFLLHRQKDIDKIIEGNYVIDKLTCEIMENKPLGWYIVQYNTHVYIIMAYIY